MEATLEHWEENEEVGIDLRGRLACRNGKTITTGEDSVYTSQSSSEAESTSAEEGEEAKGSPRNGFDMISDKNGGTESPNEIFGFNGGDIDFLIPKKSSGNEIVASEVESLSFQKSVKVKQQDEGYIKLKDEELLGFGSFPSKLSMEQNGRNASLENGNAEHEDVKFREIGEKQEVSELILEKVFDKPAAHEFYCPNCNSCITKVLLLNRELETKPETVPLPEPIDTVRCTSCFSFLIPAGFFPRSITKEQDPTDQGCDIDNNDGASISSPESNGLLQDQNSQVASVGKGSLPIESVGPSKNNFNFRIGVEQPISLQDSNGTIYDKRSPLPAQSDGTCQVVSADKTPEHYLESRVGVDMPVSLQDSNGTFYDKRPQTPTQSVVISQAVSVDEAPEPFLKSRVGVKLPVSPQESNGTLYDQKPPEHAQSVGDSEAVLIDKAPVPGDFVEASINGVHVPVPSCDSNGTLHNQKSPLPGQSVVSITVTTQSPAPEIDDAGPSESKPRESMTVIITDRPPLISEPRDAKTLDILKSIVYGGLTEVIASLSIVTSAASAGTATLNILALALANLLGGLFIIGHNLWELKVDQSRVTSSGTDEQVDRYEQVLGKRQNFILHASVAIFSFLIFGLVPPLVYCFSFRRSNDTDLKLAVVAASSLICIILLATSKAYSQMPQKYIKTLVYYVIIGVGVAGVSYIAGNLIDKLVEKLGWLDSTVAGTLPLPQMSTVKPAWKSW